ncbi:MAG: hypothetical protein KY458_13155 [Actinobacteria bacterium]|nr:hypothetical protein [Actinomycetota bacterium]
MFRRALRIGLRLGILLGVTFAVVKTVQLRRGSSPAAAPEPWEPIPAAPRPVDEVGEPIVEPTPAEPVTPSDLAGGTEASASGAASPSAPAPPAKRAPAKKAAKKAAKATKKAGKASEGAAWVEPVGGVCPPSHPVKAKLSSLIYHLPGMVAYDRTRANRCYTDPRAAESDGFVRAKR